ncbi:hypothetical protein F2Q70_00039716 [Brassica cretica]|uniref:Uncharacterized protein n=1 Tax=Brassica cretica TaxID=69181 RepID=A0A8S9K7M2_BRACR|nr:hypothetical protein F2Q70_00039716 [Brassica cretica]KAF2619857.1 hypothetical protein F2Q68_00040409 [Brassica cretica]
MDMVRNNLQHSPILRRNVLRALRAEEGKVNEMKSRGNLQEKKTEVEEIFVMSEDLELYILIVKIPDKEEHIVLLVQLLQLKLVQLDRV